MDKNSKFYIAGHTGMVGSAIVRRLKAAGYNNLVLKTHAELDLTNQSAVNSFFEKEKPEYVIIAAARVGGIRENNTYPAEFIYTNAMINMNIINAAHNNSCKKLMALGSSCIYPKMAEQPIKESSLLTGFLEPTNEAYSIGKIAAIEMCKFYKKQYGDNFISCMPTNIYGINDDFSENGSHVIPALIRKFHNAKENNLDEVVAWGTGSPLREFLYVDDAADAIVFLMENYDGDEHVNVGTGVEISIRELTEKIKYLTGYSGKLIFDTTKPDGAPRKLVDSTLIHSLGWTHKVNLNEGLKLTYDNFLQENK